MTHTLWEFFISLGGRKKIQETMREFQWDAASFYWRSICLGWYVSGNVEILTKKSDRSLCIDKDACIPMTHTVTSPTNEDLREILHIGNKLFNQCKSVWLSRDNLVGQTGTHARSN